MIKIVITIIIISTDEDPSLRIESSAIINLRGVSTKLNKYNNNYITKNMYSTMEFCIKQSTWVILQVTV